MKRQPISLSIAAAAVAATALTACQSSGVTASETSTPAPTAATATTPAVKGTPVAPVSSAPATSTAPSTNTSSAAPATKTSPTGTAGATRVVVVRPVTASGKPVAGYTVKNESMTVSCGSDASLAATDDNIASCGASAAYLPACWKSTNNTALCLRDATEKVLVRVDLGEGFGVPAWGAPKKNAHPSPLTMKLADGQKCKIRVGGAWGQVPQHPSWMGFAFCDKGDVYGPPNGDGIDRSTSPWTVQIYKYQNRTVTPQHVAVAYLVGTAAV